VMVSVRRIQAKGIEVTGGFIVGFDGETDAIFDRQRRFVQEAALPTAMVGMLMALPNTRLYRRLLAEGRLVEECEGNNNHVVRLNYVPQMPAERLLAGYKELLSHIYSPRDYFQRCRTLLSRVPPKPRVRAALRRGDLPAFFRSLLLQGASRYGLRYLSFLLGTALTRPARFPMAVTLAVRGPHYFRITREILEAHAFAAMVRELAERLSAEVARVAGVQQRMDALERCVGRILRSVRRAYQGLSEDAQQLVRDMYGEFERRCLGTLQPAIARH